MRPLKDELTKGGPERAALDWVWAGVKRRQGRRSPARLAAAALLALAAAGAWLAREPVAPKGGSSVLALADGSTVTFDDAAQVSLESGPAGVSVRVARGAAHLDMRSRWTVSTSRFSLDVAAAQVDVVAGEATDSVAVVRGEVVVSGPGVTPLTLGPGQRFSSAGATARWEALAREGRFEEAWALLGAAGVSAEAARAPAELQLLLADVAAAGRDQALSLRLLRELAASAAPPAQRALAAYTLGVRLKASEPREAAAAFERSLDLDLPPELRGEACRRAADAWALAGEPARAKACPAGR